MAFYYDYHADAPGAFLLKQHENLGFKAHFHAAMEIYFVLTGRMQAEISGTLYDIDAGEMFVVNPFEIHSYIRTENTLVNVLIIGNEYLSDFKAEYGNQFPQTHLTNKPYNADILATLKGIPFSFYNNTTLSNLAKKGHSNLVLAKIADGYGLVTPSVSQEQVIKIMRFIYENYCQKITLETLAEEFNYTKTSISRLLSKHLRMDLRSFVNKLRAEQAELLLNDPKNAKLSVLHIASLCGFDSPATFYRAYKRRYNRNPRKFDGTLL